MTTRQQRKAQGKPTREFREEGIIKEASTFFRKLGTAALEAKAAGICCGPRVTPKVCFYADDMVPPSFVRSLVDFQQLCQAYLSHSCGVCFSLADSVNQELLHPV